MNYQSFIPLLNTREGATLTPQNWQDAGVTKAAWSLNHLLIKPGVDVLMALPNPMTYFAWPFDVFLDGRSLKFNESGDIMIHSPYDGSRQVMPRSRFDALMARFEGATLVMSDNPLFFLSNRPVEDAFSGKIYTEEGIISVLDEENTADFRLFDKDCECMTCKAGLTRAYAHHLLQNTPLLAHRYLIQHNIYFVMRTLPSA